MASFLFKCILCEKKSKNFYRFVQCAECLAHICADCADKEKGVVKNHLKKTADVPGLMAHIEKEGGLKIAGKPWTWNKFCCVDCYNQKLVDLHVLPGKQPEDMEVETK